MKKQDKCPLNGFKACRETCRWYIQLRGKHPQTEQEIDEWGCAVSWLPILLIENAQEVRQGAAAVESFRNEMVKASGATMAGIGEIVRLASMSTRERGIAGHQQQVEG
ncbi:hypothetical protein RVX_R24970 [Nitratidesulfovibrio sp. HK-II]|uniref:hypothetical protein n=1 Tax=Nitratidesulfovibrio sp. HK-II TaxID=2009266 RepID=UPI0002275D47|nr:hypothetical protein [Nitratidesulfovibrio sp. HK-II]EGY24602.1 hypothetical protein DA2_3218 [Desulfovibrio sp. A2]GBO96874.1 hypothetical protein RVX_1913 [Nitratidesulfovibrio sp. HK-II]GBO98271.1 hypothetical protein RVX_3310 [Nitratidesulfovibrio sp. HK-II]